MPEVPTAHQGRFKQWLDKQVLKKHSASYNMMLLSILFMFGWALLIVVKLFRGCSLFG
jgi:hypothetical protein